MLKPTTSDIFEVISAIAALGAAIIGLFNRAKIAEVKLDVNSRMTQLLELTRSASFASGIQHQVEHSENIAAKEKGDKIL
jgi:hypothetical protein